MGATLSSWHVVSGFPSSSGGGCLTLFPAPEWGPSHGRQSSTNFSNMNPSYGLQFSTNCSSMGPFHGLQSFRNRLHQRGSPVESQVLPANLIWHGLLSPRVHRSCQEPAPSAGSPQGHSLLQASTSSSVGYSMGCRWISAPPWTSMGCRWTACLTMVFTMVQAAGESLLWCLKDLLPLLLPWPWCLQGCVSHIISFLSLLTAAGLAQVLGFFFPSFQICYHRVTTAVTDGLSLGQWQVHFGASWHWLYQTEGKLLAASHRSHPSRTSAMKTLPRKPNKVGSVCLWIFGGPRPLCHKHVGLVSKTSLNLLVTVLHKGRCKRVMWEWEQKGTDIPWAGIAASASPWAIKT